MIYEEYINGYDEDDFEDAGLDEDEIYEIGMSMKEDEARERYYEEKYGTGD